MRATVLITGGSGLLAINWGLAIRSSNTVVLGIHKRNIALSGVETRQLDLDSVSQLVRTFEAVQPNIVIHAAGLTSVEECEAKPDLARQINVGLSANVALACAEFGSSLIHVSTDHLFSGDASLVDEFHPVSPKNTYGRTKVEAEARVLDACPEALVIRTNFFGWGPSYRRSFSDTVIDALRSGEDLTLFKDVFYTPILIESVAHAAHDLIDARASGIFHLVGDERISKYEFGLKIAREFKLDSTLLKSGLLADKALLVRRPHDMSLSNNKICRTLGRTLGGVGEHIARLRQQEQDGLAREIQKL